MTEADRDPEAGRPGITLFPGVQIPARHGILCPFNKGTEGPAGEPLHCLVYDNWEAWLKQADASGEPRFCKVHCQHGRNPQYRIAARETQERRRGIEPGWQKAMQTTDPPFHPAVKDAGPPKKFQWPKRGRKVS